MIKALLIILLIVTISTADRESMPKYAKPGQCFTKSFYPPKYSKTTKIKSTKRVLINDASVKYEVIPAEYSWHKERIKISDGTEKIVTTPAKYKIIYEKVLIKPSKKVWRKSLNQNAPKALHSCVDSAFRGGMDIINAEVGTCYYEHYQPAKYNLTVKKILASEASERVVVIPAKYRTYNKKIITDSTTIKLLPSKAIYKKVKDRVVVEPARTEWKKTTCQNRGCNQSEVVCLIEVPVKYKSVTKRLVLQPAVKHKVAVSPKYKIIKVTELIEPARTERIQIPATYQILKRKEKVEEEQYYWRERFNIEAKNRITSECNKICLTKTPAKYKKIAKRVVVQPAMSRKIKTPEQYKTVKVKKILRKASYKKVIIPEEYITVVTERERTKGYSKWMPMICESNITPKMIRDVQRALKFHGFYNGEIDGIWSLDIKSSARAYQKANGLGVTSKLSIELMTSLGIY